MNKQICLFHLKLLLYAQNDKHWMTNNIRQQIRKRNKLHTRARNTNLQTDWANFRHSRNEVIDLIRTEKINHLDTKKKSLQDQSIPLNKWWKIAK